MSAPVASPHHLGIVGAGKMGTTIARLAMAADYAVTMSGSAAVERIALIVEVLAPGAVAGSVPQVTAFADLIVLVVPMHRFRELPRDAFTGKIVIDAMNYWRDTDGIDEELAAAPRGTSVVVQEWFASARVVKTLNQLGYHELEEVLRADSVGARPTMAVAGDDSGAVSAVIELVERLGFDGVATGLLAAGKALQVGT